MLKCQEALLCSLKVMKVAQLLLNLPYRQTYVVQSALKEVKKAEEKMRDAKEVVTLYFLARTRQK